MRSLKRLRLPLGVGGIAALVAIGLLGPKYNQLQLSSDADAFRRIVGDDRGRYVGAAVADIVFAAFYGLFALAVARAPLASRVGAWLVFAGAAFDEAENSVLIANVAAGSRLTDGRVELMGAMGVAKYAAIGAGLVLYLGSWAVERRRRN